MKLREGLKYNLKGNEDSGTRVSFLLKYVSTD